MPKLEPEYDRHKVSLRLIIKKNSTDVMALAENIRYIDKLVKLERKLIDNQKERLQLLIQIRNLNNQQIEYLANKTKSKSPAVECVADQIKMKLQPPPSTKQADESTVSYARSSP